MADLKQAEITQLQNIAESTGKSLQDFTRIVQQSGLEKHGQILKMLKDEHGLTHGNANLIASKTRERLSEESTPIDLLSALFPEKKLHLKPIYDELEAIASNLGEDVTVLPQKSGISLRTGKQFALITVPNMKSLKLGLKMKDITATDRLQQTTGMCTHQVVLTDVDDVDDEITAWLLEAYRQSKK